MTYLGEISAVVTVFLWSTSALLFTAASQRVGAMPVNITRLMLAMVYLWLTVGIAQLPVNLSWTQLTCLALSSLTGLVFGDTFLFKAFEQIGARLSMLIMSLAPAVAALLAFVFLKERISLIALLGMMMTLSGILLVVSQKDKNGDHGFKAGYRRGILFAFLGALGQGGGLILARLAFDEGEIHGFVAATIRITVAVIGLVPVLWMTERFRNPVSVFRGQTTAAVQVSLGSIAGPFLGITFSLIAIKYTEVAVASTIMAMVPVVLIPAERVIHHHPITVRSVAGTLWAVGGVVLLFIK